MKVAVIIPAYNAADFVAQTLDSVGGQTYRGPVVVVVVDNGSGDASYDVISRYIANYRPPASAGPQVEFRLLRHEKNMGRSAARFTALTEALRDGSVDYIMNLDSDDTLTPDAIEVLVQAASGDSTSNNPAAAQANPTAPVDIVWSGFNAVDKNGAHSVLPGPQVYGADQLLESLIGAKRDEVGYDGYIHGKLFAAKMFDGYDKNFGYSHPNEDEYMNLQLLLNARNIVKLPNNATYNYFLRKNSTYAGLGAANSSLAQYETEESKLNDFLSYIKLHSLEQRVPGLSEQVRARYVHNMLQVANTRLDNGLPLDLPKSLRESSETNPYLSARNRKLLGLLLKSPTRYRLTRRLYVLLKPSASKKFTYIQRSYL
jgi:glycosyltransferase involved in cell wall biosynthesis